MVSRSDGLTARRGLLRIAVAACSLAAALPVGATEVVGRVVDLSGSQVFANAVVRFHSAAQSDISATSDQSGFFKTSELAQGAYVIAISLADGRQFSSRLLVTGRSKTQFFEIDYSRSMSPDEDDDY